MFVTDGERYILLSMVLPLHGICVFGVEGQLPMVWFQTGGVLGIQMKSILCLLFQLNWPSLLGDGDLFLYTFFYCPRGLYLGGCRWLVG